MDDNKKLKPFDRVLVRHNYDGVWVANIFSHYSEENREGSIVEYVCVGSIYRYCIPYKGNEHLLGTCKSPECEHKKLSFLQKVIAWNQGSSVIKGYFLDKIDGVKIRYKVINLKSKDMEYFQNCAAEEWEDNSK